MYSVWEFTGYFFLPYISSFKYEHPARQMALVIPLAKYSHKHIHSIQLPPHTHKMYYR